MSKRRVVITGLGAVTPVGNTAKDSWEAMKNGVCGVGTITRFDLTGYKATVAADVCTRPCVSVAGTRCTR